MTIADEAAGHSAAHGRDVATGTGSLTDVVHVSTPPALSDAGRGTSSAGPMGGLRALLRRKGRFDAQPTERAAVLLASYGGPFSPAAVARRSAE